LTLELTDYLKAVRRHVRVWLSITALAVLAAVVVLQTTPVTYRATAQVFVSASQSIPNSAQYVQTRVKSYPALADSAAVLGPVIGQLGLKESFPILATQVSASVPVDTSEVDVVVTEPDAELASRIANAVATQLAAVVERLETPPSGNRLLTAVVTNPATPPKTPVSPVASNILGLGLIVGLFLGLALAVLRSRFDRSIHDENDVRKSWEPASLPTVLTQHHGRRSRRSLLKRNPVRKLARTLELRAGDGRLDVALLSPAPDQKAAVQAFADELATQLRDLGLTAGIGAADDGDRSGTEERPAIRLTLADPLAPVRSWRRLATTCDAAVLVLPRGRVDQGDLQEVRTVLEAAGIPALAAVLTSRRSSRARSRTGTSAGPQPTGSPRPAERTTGIPGTGPVPVPAVATRSTGAPLAARRVR
jgi:capsular polysaccharide biosynthesis protein